MTQDNEVDTDAVDPYEHPIKEILDRHDVDHYVSPNSYTITQEQLPSEVLAEIAEFDCYLYLGGGVGEAGIHLNKDSGASQDKARTMEL